MSYLHEYYFSELAARVAGGQLPQTLATIEATWKKALPDQRFSYAFLDEQLEHLYQSDRQVSRLISLSSGLALLIACFGLIGMITHMLERRIKEIGVRKVLGASAASIVALLSKDFLRLAIIGIGIGLPVGWYAIQHWLAGFAYRATVSWDIFLAVASIAIFLAFATVSFQSIKAALANPVKSLQSE